MSTLFPLVGRSLEMQILEEYVHRLSRGEGGLILVGGEAGVGKTSLVSSVLRSIDNEQITKVTCRCPGPGETPPYGPWREAIQHLQHCGLWDPVPLPAPFGQAPSILEPYEMSLELLRWLRNSGRPLVLAIEDLQWSDSASLELLRQLSGRLEGVSTLIIGVYRSEEIHLSPVLRRVLPEMLRTGGHRIVLTELTRADVEELTTLVVPQAENPARLANDIYLQTSGLPLFAAELLEQVRRYSSTTFPVTETVQQAIDMKLTLLGPETLLTLQVAALIGEQFTYSLLTEVVKGTDEDTTAALEQAMQFGVIWPVKGETDLFQFRHAIVRNVLANRMVGVRLMRCHRRIAEVIEARTPDAVDTIAFHYGQARDKRAVPFLIAAGDRALRIGALQDAEQRYRQAGQQLTEADGHFGDVLMKLGFVLRQQKDDEANLCWKRALETAICNGDHALEAWLRHLLIELAYRRGGRTSSEEIDALAALQEQLLNEQRYQQLERTLYGNLCGYPRIRVVQWSYLYTQGNLDEAQKILDDLRSQVHGENIHLLQMQARLTAFSGRLAEGTEIVRQLSHVAYIKHDYWAALELYTSYFYNSFLFKADDPDEIDTMVQELLRLEAEISEKGNYLYLAQNYSATGFYHYIRGNWKEARHHLVDYVINESLPLQLITWFAAVMLVETGDLVNLPAVLAKLPPLQPSDPPPAAIGIFTWVHAVRAGAYLLYGELDTAKKWLEAADAHPLGKVSKSHRPLIDITWTDYYRQTGNLEAAFTACRRALTWSESVPIQLFTIKARRRLGELAAAIGQTEDAISHIEDALELAELCRIPYEAGLCQLSAGRILFELATKKGSSIRDNIEVSRALQLLQSARDSFKTLGALELRETESLLASLAAVATAIDERRGSTSHGRRASFGGYGQLTDRQTEVALLVAEGLTDREVAARLHVSPKTVDHHLRSIFQRLNISHRAALAALVSRYQDQE